MILPLAIGNNDSLVGVKERKAIIIAIAFNKDYTLHSMGPQL